MSSHEENVAMDANEVQAALDAGVALANPIPLEDDATYSVVVPKGATHELVRAPAPHPDFAAAPARARGTYRPATVDALIDVVARHHDPESTTVWVHPDNGQIVAVFNDVHSGGPGWRDHRAELVLAQTVEWKHWLGKDNRLMGQIEFAEHIEDGLAEIVEPAAADMLELAQTFQAHQTASFRSAHRLQSGQVQMRYDEEIDAKAGQSGQMEIPSSFRLAVAPFLGEQPYRVEARLRFRLQAGKLSLGYKLDRPERVIRDALDKLAERLAEKFPATFIGEPARLR